ncbi:DUF1972 domain-containing protein [Methylophilus aquaticus]|uniref:DUF1972 domain-containing protein n=1 Tax=Methylophilus aquaticus TaxID=1971610 RepID=A0ABT9JTA4_9PROT|nr:DUF1972 domain-containing protein [Methylophilus aquaticus]MDP8567788.1 DUF1972 domain-containing protein [Methylophilus aquaticus]
MKTLRILGTRGIPAAHGGFETFAEHLAIYLQRRGWQVVVYCQHNGTEAIYEDTWKGIHRIHVSVRGDTPLSSVFFDLKSHLHAIKRRELCLTLGYNTAVFALLLRVLGIKNVMNMDGIEWKRQKWGALLKLWFKANDWLGCWLANQLVADHPVIKQHLMTRVSQKKITMIPYGADQVQSAQASLLQSYGLEPQQYAILIARAEPENSILEVVKAWSAKPRGKKLVVLGHYDFSHAYHVAVKDAASDEVVFVGAIYEKAVVSALRYFALFYVHGHQVGGTNPSLVESLGAGNAVLANDNQYNRWVCGDGAVYFSDVPSCAQKIECLLSKPELIQRLAKEGGKRFDNAFRWEFILEQYEALLSRQEFHL